MNHHSFWHLFDCIIRRQRAMGVPELRDIRVRLLLHDSLPKDAGDRIRYAASVMAKGIHYLVPPPVTYVSACLNGKHDRVPGDLKHGNTQSAKKPEWIK